MIRCVVVCAIVAGLAFAAGCGGSAAVRTVSTPSQPAQPPAQASAPSTGGYPVAFLRLQNAPATSSVATLADPRAPITTALDPVDIWIQPFGYAMGWYTVAERRLTSAPGPYTSVHVAMYNSVLVYSALVAGYNQIFVVPDVADGALANAIQLTTDLEHHWRPHLSFDGKTVTYTRFDLAANGDVVCTVRTSANSPETCLDFSSTVPVLRGANLRHPSWMPDDRLIFEAWGGPLNSDEIFMVNRDGTHLTQVTHNLGTARHDESPSADPSGTYLEVATCYARGDSCDMSEIDLRTNARITVEPGASDPMWSYYTRFWVSGQQIYIDWAFDYFVLTKSGYQNFFDRSMR